MLARSTLPYFYNATGLSSYSCYLSLLYLPSVFAVILAAYQQNRPCWWVITCNFFIQLALQYINRITWKKELGSLRPWSLISCASVAKPSPQLAPMPLWPVPSRKKGTSGATWWIASMASRYRSPKPESSREVVCGLCSNKNVKFALQVDQSISHPINQPIN